jgi:hypothetical protein
VGLKDRARSGDRSQSSDPEGRITAGDPIHESRLQLDHSAPGDHALIAGLCATPLERKPFGIAHGRDADEEEE